MFVVRPPLRGMSDAWSDYDGDDIYGDFTVSGGTASPVRSFEPGMGKFDWMDDGFGEQVPDDTTVAYYHTNQIGTTRVMTDASGAPTGQVAYTAFGELVSGTPDNRYGYVGAHGYQAHDFPSSDPIPYLHVGARYYDPATGRFLQRDPIGLRGGLNVYGYVRNAPTIRIDPGGLAPAPCGHPQCTVPDPKPKVKPKPWPKPPSPQEELDQIQRRRKAVKGLAGGCAIALAKWGGPPGIAAGLGIGLVLAGFEVVEALW